MPEIVVVDYRVEWPALFTDLGGRLRAALGDVAIRIDHIGSTAILGLCAKDIIDIQVTVDDLDHPPIGPAIAGIGAVERFKGTFDHEPPGQAIAEADRQKWLWHLRGGTVDANIQVRILGRWNWRYALLCRDFLRSHPATADAYGEVKRQLARHFANDAEAYYDVKDPAFDLFMSFAEEWAERVGWAPGPSDA
ncbi:MAG TPA: GrpB family protein [Acidimicrobiia bacterium]|nr:GrpB family protein [Acidimicrobiia bacterium]